MEKGAISPDGKQFAYSLNEAGIQIKDLASGSITSVPGTTRSYPDLFWTPDGRSIVFSQIGSFDLFIVNPDGSNLRQLTFGGYHEIPIGWLADGSLLYGEYEAEDQYVIYRFDLQSGERHEFSREDIQSVSPGGHYLAIGKLTFGERWQITISDVDGQSRWSLNDGDPSILFPRWSPDGQWILVAVLKPGAGATMHALIDLHTCQAIPLPHLQDDVLAWLP
jgi:TolB protein